MAELRWDHMQPGGNMIEKAARANHLAESRTQLRVSEVVVKIDLKDGEKATVGEKLKRPEQNLAKMVE